MDDDIVRHSVAKLPVKICHHSSFPDIQIPMLEAVSGPLALPLLAGLSPQMSSKALLMVAVCPTTGVVVLHSISIVSPSNVSNLLEANRGLPLLGRCDSDITLLDHSVHRWACWVASDQDRGRPTKRGRLCPERRSGSRTS